MSASANISKFLAGVQKARAKAINAARKAVDVFGEHVIGDAQQLAPVKTGALAASGTTLPAEVTEALISKVLGFNTDYAAAVHELHKTKSKFLANAIEKNRSKFETFVANRVKAALGGGT